MAVSSVSFFDALKPGANSRAFSHYGDGLECIMCIKVTASCIKGTV